MQAQPARPTPASRRRRTRTVIGVVAIVAILIYLVLSSARGAAVYYVTIAELKSQGASAKAVRVSGVVQEGSIRWDAEGSLLRFTLVEGTEQLAITYHGLRPDMLRDGASAIVKGKLTAPNESAAQTNLLQCPSKYEAAATAQS